MSKKTLDYDPNELLMTLIKDKWSLLSEGEAVAGAPFNDWVFARCQRFNFIDLVFFPIKQDLEEGCEADARFQLMDCNNNLFQTDDWDAMRLFINGRGVERWIAKKIAEPEFSVEDMAADAIKFMLAKGMGVPNISQLFSITEKKAARWQLEFISLGWVHCGTHHDMIGALWLWLGDHADD